MCFCVGLCVCRVKEADVCVDEGAWLITAISLLCNISNAPGHRLANLVGNSHRLGFAVSHSVRLDFAMPDFATLDCAIVNCHRPEIILCYVSPKEQKRKMTKQNFFTVLAGTQSLIPWAVSEWVSSFHYASLWVWVYYHNTILCLWMSPNYKTNSIVEYTFIHDHFVYWILWSLMMSCLALW